MSYIYNDKVFAYYDEKGRLICPNCASLMLDLKSIRSNQILTRDKAEKEEGLYFCQIHPEGKDNKIV
jgi:hypothetical protein